MSVRKDHRIRIRIADIKKLYFGEQLLDSYDPDLLCSLMVLETITDDDMPMPKSTSLLKNGFFILLFLILKSFFKKTIAAD
jgi:hypothetical protein